MYSSPTLTISHRPDLDLLTIRWLDALHPNLFQQDYRTILMEAQAAGCARWLVDVRRRPHPSLEIAEWAATIWLPEVVAALAPQRLRLSYLISPSREEAIRSNPALQAKMQAALQPEQAYDAAIFNDEGPATSWLVA